MENIKILKQQLQIKMLNPTEYGLSEDDFENNDIGLIWYESHLMWMQNLPTYPQKRGSRKARLFFLFLSLFLKTKTNP